MESGSAADIDLASITVDEQARWKNKSWVWCRTCGGGTINKVGRGHKKKSGHDVCSLKDAGKYDEALREFLWVLRGGRVAQEALVQQKQQAEAGVSSQSVSVAAVYTVDFGQHKRKTVSELLDSKNESDRDYLPWIFASSKPDGLPAHAQRLRNGLELEGRWEETLRRAEQMRPSLQARALQKKEEADAVVAAGGHVHPEVMQLRTMAAEKAASDMQNAGSWESSPWTQPMVPAITVEKPRRRHRSTATLENTHCSYCGEVGHHANGCAKAKEDLRAQALGTLAVPKTRDLVGEEKKIVQIIAHLKYTWIEQRSEACDQLKPRAQETHSVTGHQLCRMSARDVAEFSLQCGPCQNPACNADRRFAGSPLSESKL